MRALRAKLLIIGFRLDVHHKGCAASDLFSACQVEVIAFASALIEGLEKIFRKASPHAKWRHIALCLHLLSILGSRNIFARFGKSAITFSLAPPNRNQRGNMLAGFDHFAVGDFLHINLLFADKIRKLCAKRGYVLLHL
jgi:hypothetical protein